MDVYGVAGVLVQFLVPMVLVCGKILYRDGLLCLIIFYMKLVMVEGEVLVRLMVWGDPSCC